MKPPTESAIEDNALWGVGGSEPEADKYDGSSGLTKDELDNMKRRLNSLFGGGSGLDEEKE